MVEVFDAHPRNFVSFVTHDANAYATTISVKPVYHFSRVNVRYDL